MTMSRKLFLVALLGGIPCLSIAQEMIDVPMAQETIDVPKSAPTAVNLNAPVQPPKVKTEDNCNPTDPCKMCEGDCEVRIMSDFCKRCLLI